MKLKSWWQFPCLIRAVTLIFQFFNNCKNWWQSTEPVKPLLMWCWVHLIASFESNFSSMKFCNQDTEENIHFVTKKGAIKSASIANRKNRFCEGTHKNRIVLERLNAWTDYACNLQFRNHGHLIQMSKMHRISDM